MHFGPLEIGLILLIILIIFGTGKLPQIGGAIGKSLHAFRKEQKGEEYEKEPPKAKRKAAKKKDTGTTKK